MIAAKFSVLCFPLRGGTGNKGARMSLFLIEFFVKLVPDVEVFDVLNTAFKQEKNNSRWALNTKGIVCQNAHGVEEFLKEEILQG